MAIGLKRGVSSPSNFATGGKIFELEEEGTFRRFYNRPDVILKTPRADLAFVTLVIGSGYRADPREETVKDRIYVLYEGPVFERPADDDRDGDHYNDGLVYADSLYNARAVNEIGDPASPPNKDSNAPNGYYVPLATPGEKVLQPAITLNDVAVITSYLPNGPKKDDNKEATCETAPLGSARAYFLDINTGRSALSGEFLKLNFPGIPGEPTLVFAGNPMGGTTPVICLGTECFGEGDEPSEVLGEIGVAYRRYWRENVDGEHAGS